MSSLLCVPERYYLHINCGGEKVIVNKTGYEDDSDQHVPSRLIVHSGDWALSSSDHFLCYKKNADRFTFISDSELSRKDSQLYMSARLSPISLTYYSFCMGNGN
ncbi:hypothetical protein SLE2022_343510 [Rubroshorea leprosula]